MRQHRIDPGSLPLFTTTWEQDRAYRMHPEVITRLLRERVPVLEFIGWRTTLIEPGRAESVIPLNVESTNQHFTHQAALFVLAADYTGGLTIGSLIHGWPVAGVHPVSSTESLSLWLIKTEIKWFRPSVGDLTVLAELEPEKQGRVQRRFLDGKPVLETVTVHFRNGNVDVATAAMTYYARQSDRLRTEGAGTDKVNTLYQLKLTSSAELIAGVRAWEHGKGCDDPLAERIAGQHGLALASLFCQKLPQLRGMVSSRTRHLDLEIEDFFARGGRDLVLLGVGLDTRPFRLAMPEGTTIYELDLPTMLAERQQRLAECDARTPEGVSRVSLAIDLRSVTAAASLEGRLDPQRPLFVAWEGMSMYFEEPDVRRVLAGLAPLLAHPDSRLWVDLVDRRAIAHPECFAQGVQDFLSGMSILGEPFIFGVDSFDGFLKENGLDCHSAVASGSLLPGETDEVFELYRFCVASQKAPATVRLGTSAVRFDAGSPRESSPTALSSAFAETPSSAQNS